jgi:hypothetical protein
MWSDNESTTAPYHQNVRLERSIEFEVSATPLFSNKFRASHCDEAKNSSK